MDREIISPAIIPGQPQLTKQLSCCLCAGRMNHNYENKCDERLQRAVFSEPILPKELVSAGSNSQRRLQKQLMSTVNARLSKPIEALSCREIIKTARPIHVRKRDFKLSMSNNLSVWKSMVQKFKKISSSDATNRIIKIFLESFTTQNMLTGESQLGISGHKLINERSHNLLNNSAILHETHRPLSTESTQFECIFTYLAKILIEAGKAEMGLGNPESESLVLSCFSDSQKRELTHITKSKMRSLAFRLLKKSLRIGR